MSSRTIQPTFAGVLLLVATLGVGADPTTPHVLFEPAPAVARRAANEAAELVRFARAELGIRLDWSDASIAEVEELAMELGRDLRREGGKLSEVDRLVQLLGSYVGEVYRRNHGGSWGEAGLGGQRHAAPCYGPRSRFANASGKAQAVGSWPTIRAACCWRSPDPRPQMSFA